MVGVLEQSKSFNLRLEILLFDRIEVASGIHAVSVSISDLRFFSLIDWQGVHRRHERHQRFNLRLEILLFDRSDCESVSLLQKFQSQT